MKYLAGFLFWSLCHGMDRHVKSINCIRGTTLVFFIGWYLYGKTVMSFNNMAFDKSELAITSLRTCVTLLRREGRPHTGQFLFFRVLHLRRWYLTTKQIICLGLCRTVLFRHYRRKRRRCHGAWIVSCETDPGADFKSLQKVYALQKAVCKHQECVTILDLPPYHKTK